MGHQELVLAQVVLVVQELVPQELAVVAGRSLGAGPQNLRWELPLLLALPRCCLLQGVATEKAKVAVLRPKASSGKMRDHQGILAVHLVVPCGAPALWG